MERLPSDRDDAETHAISSISAALRVKGFMMGGPISVSPVAVVIVPYISSWCLRVGWEQVRGDLGVNRGEECRQARQRK